MNNNNNEYKISLGVKLDTSDLQHQVDTAGDNIKPIDIKVDAETKELTKTINEALKKLSSSDKNTLTLDTTKVEKSLSELSTSIKDIRDSIGTLDNNSGMKSLLSSINQIGSALEGVSKQFDSIVTDLKNLSNKNFNFGINLDIGGLGKTSSTPAGYGRKARNQIIPELKSQAEYLENILQEAFIKENKIANKVSKKINYPLPQSGNRKQRTQAYNPLSNNKTFLLTNPELSNALSQTFDSSHIKKMEGYEKYIKGLMELASSKGIDLSGFNAKFSKSATELIDDVTGISNAVDVAEDSTQKLKQIFGSGIDAEKLSGQLDSIVVNLNEIKNSLQLLSTGESLDGLTASFDKLSSSIELLIKNCATAKQAINDSVGSFGGSTGQSSNSIKNINNDLKQVTITSDNTADAIDSMKNAMSSMKFNSSSIDAATKDLEEMNIVIKEVTAKQDKNFDITVKGINDVGEAVEVIKRFNVETGNFEIISQKISKPFNEGIEAAKNFKKEIDTVNNIKFNIETDKYFNQVSQMDDNFNKLSSASKELRTSVEQVHSAYRELELAYEGTGDEVADRERLIQAEKAYHKALQTTSNLIRIQARAEKAEIDSDKLNDDIQVFQQKIDTWLTKNSAASQKFGAEMRDLQKQAQNCDRVTLNHLEKEFKRLDGAADQAGLKMQSLGDRIKAKFKEYSAYFSVAEVFMYAEQALRSMFDQVVAIDSAMTELKKVTDETNSSYDKFLTNAASKAKEIGTTVDGLVSSTADFARLGYSFKDSQGLAEVANIYAVVGDEIDSVETATQSLISTLTAFKNEANGLSDSDFALSIVDKMNEVSNNFAISSGGIGEALQRSASSMMAANNSLDETIALITAANTVVQDADTVGTAFKTISMRIRGAKTEMEEAGLETDGMASSTAKLREEIMALSGVDIMLNANEFKSTYQIMEELADKWQDLTDIQQASVTELIAGKRQGNIVSSLMNNFDIAEQALETSLNSAGSAMKEHEKWQQSLEAQLLKLKAAWQGLSQAFLSSDFLKVALDGVIGLVDGLTKLIDTFGALPTLAGIFAGGLSLSKNKGFFTFDKESKSILLLGDSLDGLKNKYNNIQTAIERYNSMSSKSVAFQDKYNKAMANSSSHMGKYLSGLKGAKASFGGYITSLVGATVKTVALEAATIAFNAALTMGISFLISTAISAISKWINAADELSEKVDEITSKFKEQHEELKKLKGDYDTTNESSMISKYEKLSKGVDNLGRNVSLTADEYSEYQSIVGTIAEQIPSLVTGYDEQGNALLSCKGNVEELTEAYEKLIHAQNQEILTNAGNIEEDFANTIEKAEYGAWYKNIGGIGGGTTTSSMKLLDKILNGSYSESEIKNLLINANDATVDGIYESLKDAGIGDLGSSWSEGEIAKTLSKSLKTDSVKIKGIIDDYYSEFNDEVEKKKTPAQAKLSEAFDISSAISGLDYGNISEDLQAVAYQVVNGLDFDFFSELSKNGETVEQWTTEMLDQLNSIGKENNTKIEAAFDLQTKFNGGEISYGEYVKGLEDTGRLIDGLNLKPELESQLKLSLGLDEDGFVEGYKKLKERLASEDYFNIMPSDYTSFINSLSSEEVSVLWNIIPELEETDYKETVEDIKAALERQMMLEGLTFKLNLEVEAAGIESLNTALAESVSASGLSSESISALKSRYSDLESQGYDLSSMFEETSHGIHLNRKEFNKLESAYATQKLNEVNGQLDEMQVAYDQLGEDIKNCTDPVEKSKLFSDRQLLAQRISEAATLASQYQGLTSAYNDWLAAEEAGQERDMYENVISGFETIDDELSRGWIDDSAIEFLELLTGRTDLAGKSGKQLKEIYDGLDESIKYLNKDGKVLEDTGYSIRDFFTVDEDGNSTNTGIYNFLDAIGRLEEEAFGGKDVVQRDDDGNIIGFDFKLAGGDEAIAEALGVSEELVQIMVRAADDAGFVVSLDGTYKQLADLQNEAKAAANTLKEMGMTDFEFDFNTSSVESLTNQLDEAHKILDNKDFWNKDGTFNFNADGATQAMTIVSTLQAKLDNLSQEKYGIGLKVEDEEFEEPLENLQDYGHKIATLNQLELNPKANFDEIEKINGELDEIAQEFNELPDEKKVKLGLVDDSGTPLDNIEDIRSKIESGEVTIPTVLDIQANMDKNIETLADLALLNSGLLSENQEETIRKKYNVEVEADEVDTSDVDEKIDNAFNIGVGRNSITRSQNIEIIAETFGVENIDDLSTKLKGLDDKTIQAIAEVIGQIDVDRLRNTLGLINPVHVQAIAEALGKGDVDALKEAIGKLEPTHVQAIAEALGYDDVNGLNAAIENLDPKTVQAVAEALGITDVNGLKSAIDNVEGKNVEVNATTSGESKLTGLKGLIDSIKSKTVTITSWFKKITSGGSTRNDSNGYGGVNGTANVDGTTGQAFKQGSWGIKDSGTALVGELGTETLVRDGHYYTIGNNGAEFIKYRKGDIIFNHKQTEELFKNGRVTSGGGRGRAIVDGTAFAFGSSGSGGIGKATASIKDGTTPNTNKIIKDTVKKTVKKVVEAVSGSTGDGGIGKNEDGKGTTGGSGSGGGSSSEKDKFEETIDWIEVAINRIERAIDQLDSKANNVYKNWSDRNTALVSEISKVEDEIALQEKAYNRYIQQANSVGLDESWAKKVREGTIDISTITDEGLAEKIKEYQTWFEKALSCQDAIDELKEKEAALYKQRFDNVSAQYEGILGVVEHEKNMLEEYISQTEAQAWLVSENYYKALSDNERDNISELEKQKTAMLKELQTAMESGTIDKYSEAWYEMVNAVDEVTLSITQGKTKLLEYEQTLQQLSWERFDLLQEKISAITEESEFLIELLSNEKLYDDNGQLTDAGMSTMGLHGQNYNVYMAQADQAAAEAERLKAELAKDPYDTELEARYREMISLQQEHILAAQDEKEAIRDMVEEGIQLELDALQERIDKYNEALDSQKDLYDYQKKVKEQTEEIASLEKQMAAYAGDGSEEAKVKVQELKVSLEEAKTNLEETEYDKYISDQQQLLDNLYLEYETILNTRLDNVDVLIADMIAEINTNASTISATLSEKADSVGYSLSDSMTTIWDNNSTKINDVITTYGEKFSTAQTTTNNALSTINSNLQKMITQLNSIAKTNTKSASTSSAANSKEANATKKATTTTNKTTTTNNTKPSIAVGGMVNASGAQIYDYAGDTSGERQLYRNDPKYKVLRIDGNWVQVRWHKLSSGVTGWFKKSDVSAYKTGKKNFSEDEIAWTQDGGREFIVRPSDGAILTPIAKGDSVLNANASSNIWNMANTPSEFIRDNLNLGSVNVPNNSNVNNNVTQNISNNLNFPNVKSYEEMLIALSRDPKFQKLVDAMTTNQYLGKSSLAKGKSIR